MCVEEPTSRMGLSISSRSSRTGSSGPTITSRVQRAAAGLEFWGLGWVGLIGLGAGGWSTKEKRLGTYTHTCAHRMARTGRGGRTPRRTSGACTRSSRRPAAARGRGGAPWRRGRSGARGSGTGSGRRGPVFVCVGWCDCVCVCVWDGMCVWTRKRKRWNTERERRRAHLEELRDLVGDVDPRDDDDHRHDNPAQRRGGLDVAVAVRIVCVSVSQSVCLCVRLCD